ncbi:hypothetical protein F2Q69_00011707 [Brassica cretica]|uniref:Uncharacterized protein n=1 Tax=Brassica cretica TaxID=69181 RepID=A0A8S9QW61_BRACR|nr:hypothetical protein F2Q69_00011707 [Brassica cretica]
MEFGRKVGREQTEISASPLLGGSRHCQHLTLIFVSEQLGNLVSSRQWYRAQISVYDNSEQAVFVLLGDAGRALTGKHTSELVSSYFEVPVPEALISTIGQRHKFCVKATEHNLSGKTRSLTVSKILSLDTPPATEALAGNHIAATSEETFQTGNDV